MLHFGNVRFDSAARRVWRGTREIELTRKAFDLLEFLIDRRPNAVSKEEIHARLWPRIFVAEITLYSLVSELRRALGDDVSSPRFIRTVHRFGYAFVSQEGSDSMQAAGRRIRGWLIGDAGRLGLFDGENLLGRGEDDVVELPSTTVSRRHANIRIDDGAWLEDLGSKNGTFVGDARVIATVRLADGDRIRIGSLQFTFRFARTDSAGSTQSATRHAVESE